MSLFDVIRYPVSDWRNADELAEVPLSILRPWAEDCLAHFPDSDLTTVNKLGVDQILLRLTATLFNECKDRDGFTDVAKMDIYNYYFTLMLKSRIRDA